MSKLYRKSSTFFSDYWILLPASSKETSVKDCFVLKENLEPPQTFHIWNFVYVHTLNFWDNYFLGIVEKKVEKFEGDVFQYLGTMRM